MGGSSGGSAPEMTDEEKALLATQNTGLQEAVKVFLSDFNISQEDRGYFEDIYRGGVDPNDPEVRTKVTEAINRGKQEFEDYDGFRGTMDEYVSQNVLEEDYREYDYDEDGYSIGQRGGYIDEQKYANDKMQAEQEYRDMLASGEATEQKVFDESEISNNILTQLQDTTKSVDSIMFDAVQDSGGQLELALGNYVSTTQKLNEQFGSNISGLSEDMVGNLNQYSQQYETRIGNIAKEYENNASAATQKYGELGANALKQYSDSSEQARIQVQRATDKAGGELERLNQDYSTTASNISSKMGQADQDIESITRGRELAGISSSVKEAQDNLMSTMSRRGLEGTGVEAGAMSQLASDEARMKSGAYSSAYTQAVGASDARRNQQLGIAGNIYQSGVGNVQQQLQNELTGAQYGQGVAGQVYGAQSQYAQGIYGAELGLSGNVANMNQQAAQGIYGSGTQAGAQAYNTYRGDATAMYGVNSALGQTQYQGTAGNISQNLANQNMLAAAGNNVYTGAMNYAQMAGVGFGQVGGTAGNLALGHLNNSYELAGVNASQGNTRATTAMAGATAGSMFGPWGAAIGGVGGYLLGG